MLLTSSVHSFRILKYILSSYHKQFSRSSALWILTRADAGISFMLESTFVTMSTVLLSASFFGLLDVNEYINRVCFAKIKSSSFHEFLAIKELTGKS